SVLARCPAQVQQIWSAGIARGAEDAPAGRARPGAFDGVRSRTIAGRAGALVFRPARWGRGTPGYGPLRPRAGVRRRRNVSGCACARASTVAGGARKSSRTTGVVSLTVESGLRGSARYDEPVSRVICLKGEQLGVAVLPITGLEVAPQSLE